MKSKFPRFEKNIFEKYLVQAWWDGTDEGTCSIVVRDLDSGWNVFDEEYDFTGLVRRFCDTVDYYAEKYWREKDAI